MGSTVSRQVPLPSHSAPKEHLACSLSEDELTLRPAMGSSAPTFQMSGPPVPFDKIQNERRIRSA